MKSLAELIVLLPCHSLEDFPLYLEGDNAEGLLAAWSALWHPRLLAAAGKAPKWYRADVPPDEFAGRVIVIPAVSEPLLLAGWADRAAGEGAIVIRRRTSRNEIVAAILDPLSELPTSPMADEIAADFLALGFCYLQIELLTRQMRYMSNIDEVHLETEAVQGAKAAVAGDAEEARRRLRACFDTLTEARERFYPVDAYLLDLTLVAETTLSADLRSELASPAPTNLLITGTLLERLADSEPETLTALREAVESGTAAIVGGEHTERPLPLLPLESVLLDLRCGANTIGRILGTSVTVFGRRRYGLAPFLPGLLSRLGFDGALHFTLDDGHFPQGGQTKVRWEGLDGSLIDAIAKVPLSAEDPGSFLGFPSKLGRSMDNDHVATVVFAHWPTRSRVWYDDLRRATAYAPVFGRFVTLTDYFRQTEGPGHVSRFKADDYRAPYLRQAAARGDVDPISRFVRHRRRRAALTAARTLETWAALQGGELAAVDEGLEVAIEAALDNLAAEVDQSGESAAQDARLEAHVAAAIAAFGGTLPRDSDASARGVLIANPLATVRAVAVGLPGLPSPPVEESPIVAVEADGDPVTAVVEVPPLGFAWIGPGPADRPPPRKAKKLKPLAEDNILRNEFMEIALDREGGGIRAIHDFRQRGNRLSQQLALRRPGAKPRPGDVWRDPDSLAVYSVMAADAIEVLRAGPAVGEIRSRGRLLDQEGRRLAGFEQRLRLTRASRILRVSVVLDCDALPQGDPWDSYYAARFAWGDPSAELHRGVGLMSQPTEAKRIEAPDFIEIQCDASRTAILTGGLPYHRRSGERMLDCLLVVEGERERRFEFAIAIDCPHPAAAAVELLSPVTVHPDVVPPPAGNPYGWLFHIDARDVVVTHWEPLIEDGKVCGFVVRLLETAGRARRPRLRTFRPVQVARQVDFRGQPLIELALDGDAVRVDLGANEWVQIEARW